MDNRQTEINARLGRLDKLASATRDRFGTNAHAVRVPARLIVDFDPWAISLDMVATSISLSGLRTEIDLSRLPRDSGQLLAPGDLYRIQFQTDSASVAAPVVLPLMSARLEQQDANHGPGSLQLRFKWLLDAAVEREFQKFLQGLHP